MYLAVRIPAKLRVMVNRILKCPECGSDRPARTTHVTPFLNGDRILHLEAECNAHGIIRDSTTQTPFEKGATLKLSGRNTVACPKCGGDSDARVTDESKTIGAPRTRLIEAECPVDGRFYGREVTPLAGKSSETRD